MRLHLRRTYLEDATVGVLRVEHEYFATLEDTPGPPGETNHCVPEGLYALVPHDGSHYRGTWALVNEKLSVAHWPKPGMRSACVIHAGNTVEHTLGCLLVGLWFELHPTAYLTRSADARERVLDLLGRERTQSHDLLIEGA